MSDSSPLDGVSLRDLANAFDYDLTRALSEPARVELLLLLFRDGPSDITTLASALVQDRSVVSRHLKLLHQEGLVELTRQGRSRIYTVAATHLLSRVETIARNLRAVMQSCCPDQLENL